MRRMAVRYYLLNKRLFKKISFLLILCLVPALVGGMRLAAQGENGILTVALCMRNPEDALSAEIIGHLMDKEGILRYRLCGTQEEARGLVETFEADAAWIFPADLAQALRENARSKRVSAVVTVVEREDNIALKFSRELLCSALYPYFTREIYEDFIRDDLEMDEKQVSGEALDEAYRRAQMEEMLFQMVYMDGGQAGEEDYLLTPLRGILAIWLVLCGFVGSMYFIQDEERGTYARMSGRQRLGMSFGALAVILSDAVVVLVISCRLTGIFNVWPREILSAALFAGCAMAFCNLIRLLCCRVERMGSCIPVLLLGMLVLCPVFLQVNVLKPVRYLLPPYYYLYSFRSDRHLCGMAVYILVFTLLCRLVYGWQNREIKQSRKIKMK